MCGITGFWGQEAPSSAIAKEMAAQILHRGPDDSGVWVEGDTGLALGHRRLAIVDLSAAGHQPMHSACERFVIAFNGEIYNHLDLRKQLDQSSVAPVWRGHADTETLLAAFSAWGIERTLEAANGMFAIALWDRQLKTLTLARDRFGEKPLYYGLVGKRPALVFGSELKALAAHPDWQPTLNQNVLDEYLRFGCVRGAASIYQGIHKLLPGSYVQFTQSDIANGQLPEVTQWWSPVTAALAAKQAPVIANPDDAVEQTRQAMMTSVGQRMMADVPLGAFLSGGVDSSLVVALMQAQSSKPVRTFSVGFDDARYDESSHAAAVAAHLGTDHTTLKATSQMALDTIPQLADMYDEPFADSSQIPTALIASLTRQHVTVALSGDGGDELFGGYNRHVWVPQIWSKLNRLPVAVRKTLALSLRSIPVGAYDGVMNIAGRVLPKRLHVRTFGEKLHKLAAVLESPSQQALFAGVSSMNRQPGNLLNAGVPTTPLENLYPALQQFDAVEWMLLMDTMNFMVDDALVKVDRASMASTLEVRVPFLDPNVFHTAWRIPASLRIKNGQGKWPLRETLYQHVPAALIDRPKMGFAIPLDEWLRGPLREWAEDLLQPASLVELPMLNVKAVGAMWKNHVNGKGHYAQQLWAVLQLLAWQRRWRC
ncbi:asparagine synthase (glutamine-hydrolysing) [Marinobacter sp. LV10R520-4]|uniref:asparagine synthase (glutamine-hydrolyzing) n=1 Tax=Marinobacter sp. LV10R520-4 TaxID=1761796 RepID=UPI000BF2B89D|nr:asparagine synthase (glutamine-hydrolyzing) [Marinobacter sp. LV10R520-4]PFG53740.1 asparagine synthase (glutamine-hydrolysing) [Marinobacter sp. LV10R520-4]